MKPSKLDRSLRLFTDVRPGEGTTALLLFANAFLVLCAYYFVKPLREGWISVSDVGSLSKIEVKAYTSFGQSLLLLPTVWWYGRLADRYKRSALITRATLFCMTNLVVFWFLQPNFFFANLPYTGIFFYLWVGMFGVFIVAQIFAFAADVYTDERGRRLLPFIALGATAGAAFGSGITDRMVDGIHLGPRIASLLGIEVLRVPVEGLLIAALIPLLLSIALTRRVDLRETNSEPGPMANVTTETHPESRRGALALVLTSRFLLAVGLVTLLVNWVNTNGENVLFRVVQDWVSREAAQAGVTSNDALLVFRRDHTTLFYGEFFFWVNFTALVLQAFIASRLLKYGGFAAILLMLPVIALGAYSAMAVASVYAISKLMSVVKVMKTAENATDYSINNTARHVLWLPLSSELTYKGKPTIDTLFARVGDGIAALTVFVGVQILAFQTTGFFAVNIALGILWLVVAFVVISEHRRISALPGGVDAA